MRSIEVETEHPEARTENPEMLRRTPEDTELSATVDHVVAEGVIDCWLLALHAKLELALWPDLTSRELRVDFQITCRFSNYATDCMSIPGHA